MLIQPEGGVNEIGGNAFFIKTDKVNLLLDFGKSFKRENIYFSGFLQPRTSQGIKDFLEFEIIPRIPGLYAQKFHVDGLNKVKTDACFISHAHLDHFGNIDLLHDDIPIYMGYTAATIIQSIQDTGRSRFGRSYIQEESDTRPSNTNTFRTGDTLNFSNVEVTPIHVDHSLPGSYGFIIENGDTNKTIGYTGDLRLHGWRRDLTQDFIAEAKRRNLDGLLIEGTNINEDFDINEERVQRDLSKALEATNGLAIANYSLRDIDRFRSFYLATKENNRKLLINTKQAYLLLLLQDDIHLEIPRIEDPHIELYKRPKRRHYRWEQVLFDNEKIKTIDSPDFDQRDYVFQCDFWNLTDLIDIKPESNSTFFYSHGDPFDEEGMIEMKRLMEWIEHFCLDFRQYHASGHAPQRDLINIVNEISPKIVIPIHSETPEMYNNLVDIPVLLPQRGQQIKI
ncbi:MAG: MBL fold metallo-hydrolase [Candidatus Hodarchaeota archaeon]